MKITIPTNILRNGIARVADTTKQGGTLPIIGNLLLEASEGILTLTGTNLDQMAKVPLACEVLKEGKTTLPCARFGNIVRAAKDESIALELVEDVMTIQAGQGQNKLPTLPADEFPLGLFPEGDNDLKWEFNPAELRNVFIQLSPSQSTDPARYILNGILMRSVGKLLKWVATDGRVLSVMETENPGSEANVIIPSEFVRLTVKMLDDETIVTLVVSPSSIKLIGGSSTLASKLLEGVYPGYEPAIPTSHTGSVSLNREEFLDCLNRRAAVGADHNKETTVNLIGTRNNLELIVHADTPLESRESMGAKIKTPFEVRLNARFIDSALRNLLHDEVRLEYADTGRAIVFRAANFMSVVYALVPKK